ncbi:hypothetical protein DSL92_01480 [Billgrantia gudaonensis]|uniref:Uncharacterized protein n=1 Tax=Billgrantia gudaonensis TaxID=376427 RepID=A0A3S0QGA7_9GAMM|nr:hypothetical protein DSL92_01480 [Halomonas gudaonensis]
MIAGSLPPGVTAESLMTWSPACAVPGWRYGNRHQRRGAHYRHRRSLSLPRSEAQRLNWLPGRDAAWSDRGATLGRAAALRQKASSLWSPPAATRGC